MHLQQLIYLFIYDLQPRPKDSLPTRTSSTADSPGCGSKSPRNEVVPLVNYTSIYFVNNMWSYIGLLLKLVPSTSRKQEVLGTSLTLACNTFIWVIKRIFMGHIYEKQIYTKLTTVYFVCFCMFLGLFLHVAPTSLILVTYYGDFISRVRVRYKVISIIFVIWYFYH